MTRGLSTGVRAGARDTLGRLVSAGMTQIARFISLKNYPSWSAQWRLFPETRKLGGMALAEERLAEVEALSARGGQDGVGIDRALNRYDSELAGAIAE